ncbi:MAG: FAD-binding protein [Sutterellaceae bacterium]|nr:FAD-binding protein [Sutterellaceae bacterium]
MIGAITAQAAQKGGQPYLVMDAATFELFRNGIKNNGVSPSDVDLWLAENGTGTPLFAHGKTLEEAAKHAGIDPKGLTAEVAKYNEFVKAGVDKDYGRTAKNMTAPIGEGPYYIVEQKPRFATTMGSLVVNRDLAVLNTQGAVIEGLFAAGEIVNSVHGDDSAPAANVGWAATSGKTASDAAVRYIRTLK